MQPLETMKLTDGNTLEIYLDYDAESPRTYMDNGTEMYCFHNRLRLGDDHDLDASDYSGWDGMVSANTKQGDIVLPLYIYEHGGVTISTEPFSCPWDSGRVGFIVVREDVIRCEFNGDREKALKCLQSELNTYDQWLRGETYGFCIVDEDGDVIESCWGFYGSDHVESGLADCAGLENFVLVSNG
jgi:hypothetical protein